MRISPTVLALLLLGGGLAACSKAPTTLQREQAASIDADAQYAITLGELPRAEGLLVQETTLCPDTAAYWMSLGEVRATLGNRDGARGAYKSALSACRAEAKRVPGDGRPVVEQVILLSLLGRADDARDLLASKRRENPDDRILRQFEENRGVDGILADPHFAKWSL